MKQTKLYLKEELEKNVKELQKVGLPWMNNMTVLNSTQCEVAYVMIDNEKYLIVSGTNGMLFKKSDVDIAEDRFRGAHELTK